MSNETTLVKDKKTVSPELRFKSFKDEWKNAKMSDMITFISGFAFESSKMLTQIGKYQLIKMSNVYKSELQLDRSPSYWDEIDEKHEKVLLRKGDTILTLTGTVGKRDYGYSVIIPENNKFLLNQRLVCLRSKGELTDSGFINGVVKTSHFLYHFFNESKGGTGNQSNVGVEDLRNIKVAFPSLPEQQKIASFLKAVDEKIQQLTRKKELLEQYKKGVMQQLFSGKLRFKPARPAGGDENGKAYPKWEEKKMGEVFSEIREKVQGRNIATYSITAGLGFISQLEKFGKNISGNQSQNYILVKPGQFSYNKGASKSFRYGCIYQNKFNYEIAVPHVFISFELINKKMTADFYSQLFGNHYLDTKLKSIISSSARLDGLLNVNKDLFFGLSIPIPCCEEQKIIASYLTALDAKIESVAAQIAYTQTFKNGLLQQMFV